MIGTARNASHRWVIVAALFLLHALNFADKAVIGLAADPIMREMHLSHAEFGRISSSFFMFFAVSTLVVGIISNRVKTRWILVVLVLFWSVSQLPILLWATPAALLTSRILLGAGEGPTYIMAIHSLYKWFPEKARMLPTTIFAVGVPVGMGVIAPAVTWVIVRFGWRAAFLVLGGVGVVWVLAWLMVGHEGPLDAVRQRGAYVAAPRREDEVGDWGGHIAYWRLLTSRSCIGVIICGFCAYITVSIALIWLPSYLEQVDGYSMRVTGFILTLPSFLNIAVCPALGWWSQHMQQRGVSTRYTRGMMSGSVVAITGLTITLIPVLRTEWLNMIMIAIAFSISSFTFSAGIATISEISPPRQRGAMFGLSASLQTIAGLLAPMAMGYVIDMSSSPAAGYKTGMVLAGGLTLCGGILGAILINPERDRLYFMNRARREFAMQKVAP
ncbi:Sugar phosphate permease [Burkholderia sp. D7]|nr:Sugar phosphate permease [Burkholderia sp. D7]